MGTVRMKTSKYQQIIHVLKKAIQDGELETGEKIPSVRQLASQFSCSKDTVQRALLDLTYQHFLYAKLKVATSFWSKNLIDMRIFH